MKALTCATLDSPDSIRLVDKPIPAPQDNQVLVRVHASSVNALDWRPFTIPRVILKVIGAISGMRVTEDAGMGADLAGRVESVGAAVRRFKVGDDVFGSSRGAFAEFVCAVEEKLALKPANVSYEAAAATPVAALTALQGLRDHGRLQPGQRVLINGAGGGVGTFAVQIAKALGAHVTAVCSSRNQGTIRAIGADRVIDYSREDVTTIGEQFDLILAVNGNHSVREYRRVLAPKGICVVAGGSRRQLLQGMFIAPVIGRFGQRRFKGMMTRPNREDLEYLASLLEAGTLAPVIDRRYRLDQVGDAIRHLMNRHSGGKVVINVADAGVSSSGAPGRLP